MNTQEILEKLKDQFRGFGHVFARSDSKTAFLSGYREVNGAFCIDITIWEKWSDGKDHFKTLIAFEFNKDESYDQNIIRISRLVDYELH